MHRHGGLDALGNGQFVLGFEQAHGSTIDARGENLFGIAHIGLAAIFQIRAVQRDGMSISALDASQHGGVFGHFARLARGGVLLVIAQRWMQAQHLGVVGQGEPPTG